MELGPIWRALTRNKAGYILIALQIAVTMAIIVNAIAIIQERSRLMARPSGVDEDNLFYLANVTFKQDTNIPAMVDQDLANLRAMPGVVDAIFTNSVPLRNGGWSMGLATEPGQGSEASGVAVYFVDEHGSDTFGVVGKTVYINEDNPVQIIGILERLQAPWNGWDGVERSMLVPLKREMSYGRYAIRAAPGQRDRVIPAVEKMLADSNRDRIIKDTRTMTETRTRSYLGDAALVKLLSFIVILLTVITGLGIVGLASFSVSRRTRQIGTRRALGATRGAILRYFMLENFLVSSVGIALGGILAVALNMWMVETFELTRIAWYLIPLAMVMLWIVGQLAVAGPARRASMVPPAVATRAI